MQQGWVLAPGLAERKWEMALSFHINSFSSPSSTGANGADQCVHDRTTHLELFQDHSAQQQVVNSAAARV